MSDLNKKAVELVTKDLMERLKEKKNEEAVKELTELVRRALTNYYEVYRTYPIYWNSVPSKDIGWNNPKIMYSTANTKADSLSLGSILSCTSTNIDTSALKG